MNEDSNKYLVYFIAMTAIFCLSTAIIHKMTHSSSKNSKNKKDLEKSFSYNGFSNNGHEPFDEKEQDSNNNFSFSVVDPDQISTKSFNSNKVEIHEPLSEELLAEGSSVKENLKKNINSNSLTMSFQPGIVISFDQYAKLQNNTSFYDNENFSNLENSLNSNTSVCSGFNNSFNRINFMYSNGKNYSFKLYEKYKNNTLFKEIASKALIYSFFLTWFEYFDELEQILKNDKLSKSLLKLLQNKKLSKDQKYKICNDEYHKIIENLKKTNANEKKENIKKNHSLNSKYVLNSISKKNTFFTNDNKNYFSLQDYQKYEDTPLFKEIAAKALIQLNFLNWFAYKKELQIIFSDEILSNCLIEVLKYDDEILSQYVFYCLVNKMNKEKIAVTVTKKDVKKSWDILNTEVVELHLKKLFNSDGSNNTKKINSILKNKKLAKSIAFLIYKSSSASA